ncbi:MAG: hypothetical protein C4547_09675 [Phycisphaerales bacterium]|nr:MAG: hypothetical protein C4547_09675 [Phycisphaerales bacterium]
MKLMANENIPRLLVARLRERGHDVRWLREEMSGIGDPQVLDVARAEGRVLLTSDKDFGELAFRHGLPATCGIVLCRLGSRSQSEFAERVLPVLEADESRWIGHFSIIGPRRVRVVPLPGIKTDA